jgi:hypothetical protein
MEKYRINLVVKVTKKKYEGLKEQCMMQAFDCSTPGELVRFICEHKLKGINENINVELVSEERYDTNTNEKIS